MIHLQVERLSFAYGDRPVLKDVSFSLRGGEFLSVLGPNGAGKSTLFRCILGSLSRCSGRILLGGDDVRTLSRREMAKRIAYIPQIHRPTFGYTALDTALMGTAHQLSAFEQPGHAQIQAAMRALERVGAEHLAHRDYARLSGGEQQLVLIARAIAQQAEMIVMDEPTSSLDYGNQLRVLELVRELARDGYAVLLSTHHPQHALTYATHILALADGVVAVFGTPETALTPELIRRLYGVEAAFVDTSAGRVIAPLSLEGGRR